LLISNHNGFPVLFDKIAFVSHLKYIYILALKMASPGNQHCANCIGTLLFPILAVAYDISFRALFAPHQVKSLG